MEPGNRKRATDLLQRATSRISGRQPTGQDTLILAAAVGAVILVALVAIIASIASIAEGSPDDDDAPSAASGDCRVSPRSVESLVAVAGTPVAEENGAATDLPEMVTSESDLPDGDDANDDAVDGITETTNEFIACVNAGENLRAYALVSDDYVRRQFDGNASDAELLFSAMDQTPTPVAEENRLAIVTIRDARELDDSRVGAVVVGRNGAEGEESASFLIFVELDDRWLLDGDIAITPNDEDTDTTPEPQG